MISVHQLFLAHKPLVHLRTSVREKVPLLFQFCNFIQVNGGNHEFVADRLCFRQYFTSWRDDLTATDIFGAIFYTGFAYSNDEDLIFHRAGTQHDLRGFLSNFFRLTETWCVVRYAEEFGAFERQGTVTF